MKFSVRRSLLLSVAMSAFLISGSAAARQSSQPQQQGQASQAQTQQPNYSISMTVPVVNIEAVVTDSDGNYLTGLKKENFRVSEDGSPQVITNFATSDAPITIVLLVEYSRMGYGWYLYNARNWSDVFLRELKPTDWVALESFAMRPNIEVDFTHDTSQVREGLISMSMPTFTESVVFDALADTVDRLRDVKGKKAILLLASGRDTFSKLTLSATLAKLKESDVAIYAVGVGEREELQREMYGGSGADLDYLQAQNQLRTFSAMTGGRAWFPRFDGEIPGVMSDVAASLRNQYSIGYSPTNQNQDGKYRKIKVELVAPDGGPYIVTNAKGKKIKYQVYARQGYMAPKNGITQMEVTPLDQPNQDRDPGKNSYR